MDNIFQEITEVCRFLLIHNSPNSQIVQEYLDKRISKASQENFQFGFFPDDLSKYIDESKLLKAQILYEKNFTYFYEDYQEIERTITSNFKDYNLVFPYKNPYGQIIGLVARSLDYETLNIPKYKNTHFKKSQNLFGLDLAKHSIIKNDFVYVVEGQFDLIKAIEKNITNIVAVGSSNLSLYQVSLLSRYTHNINLLFDNDEAGIEGRKKAISKFRNYVNFANLYIPKPFKDLDEYLCSLNEETPHFIFKG